MSVERGCECCETGDPGDATCYCPIDDVLDTVAKRYAMQVITVLGANGPTRYGDLADALAVTSTSTFSDRLDELVEAGLVERRRFDEVPPRVEYSLTPRGRELEVRLQPLLDWASGDD